LFGVAQIPCDNQVRNLLDPLAPSALDGVFVAVFEGLEQHGSWPTLAANNELMEMVAFPTHDDLEDRVQVRNRAIASHEEASPNSWSDLP